MREIKFRGKRINNSEWGYGCLLKINDKSYIYPHSYGDLNDIDFGFGFYEVDPKTVGQYTGLKDCEGSEIYEGDIVENKFTKASQIIFTYGMFCIEKLQGTLGQYILGQNVNTKIIGNIFENPELLGEANEK